MKMNIFSTEKFHDVEWIQRAKIYTTKMNTRDYDKIQLLSNEIIDKISNQQFQGYQQRMDGNSDNKLSKKVLEYISENDKEFFNSTQIWDNVTLMSTCKKLKLEKVNLIATLPRQDLCHSVKNLRIDYRIRIIAYTISKKLSITMIIIRLFMIWFQVILLVVMILRLLKNGLMKTELNTKNAYFPMMDLQILMNQMMK